MEENLGRPGVWPEIDQQIERGSQGQVARSVPDADEEEDGNSGGGDESDGREAVLGEKVGVCEESDYWREKIAVESETELHEDETGAAAEKAEQRKGGCSGEEAGGSSEEGEFACAGEEERSGEGFERWMRYYVICF